MVFFFFLKKKLLTEKGGHYANLIGVKFDPKLVGIYLLLQLFRIGETVTLGSYS